MKQIELQTERLILKSITPDVIHELFETKSKKEIIAYFGCDNSAYEHYKEMHEKGMETNRISLFFFLIIEKQTNIPIGVCGFHTWNKSHNRTEIFYSIYNEKDKKKGLMTETLKTVLNFGFNELNLHRVQAMVDANNIPSVKLLLRYDFVKEGTMREDYVVHGVNEDSDCYSLLKWEWKNNLVSF